MVNHSSAHSFLTHYGVLYADSDMIVAHLHTHCTTGAVCSHVPHTSTHNKPQSTFTHSSSLHTQSTHKTSTHKHVHTQTRPHTNTSTHKHVHTQTRPHTNTSTHKHVHTQNLILGHTHGYTWTHAAQYQRSGDW